MTQQELAALEAEIAQQQERAGQLGQELGALPGQIRAALLAGDDKAYRKLRDRQEVLPAEVVSQELLTMRLRLGYLQAEAARASADADDPALGREVQEARAAFEEAAARLKAAEARVSGARQRAFCLRS